MPKRIYLDNASATPVDKRVFSAMSSYFTSKFANPSGVYKEGVEVKKILEEGRRDIAKILKCRSNEIVFTGGATESINMAISGVISAWKNIHHGATPEIITSSIEHEAVLSTCRALEKWGVKVHYIKPNENGVVDSKEVEKLLNKNTALVSIMYANNEIGTIQPIKEIGRIIKIFKLEKNVVGSIDNQYPVFHTDACQATNYLSLDVNSLGLQALTLNSAKIYGPKGVGILFIKEGISISPLIYGGGQEKGLRSGTENVPLVIGLVESLKLTEKIKNSEFKRLTKLRDYFIKELLKISGVALNGSEKDRLPNNVNISIDGIDNEFFVIKLDNFGVACSTRSACKVGDEHGSHVILSLGKSEKVAGESLRFTLGRSNTKSDIDYTIKTIKRILNK